VAGCVVSTYWFQGLDLAAQLVVLAVVIGLSLKVSAWLDDDGPR
jgi:hypothetical protein